MNLVDFITPELIQLQTEPENWQEAIRIGGTLLVQQGFCNDQYVEAMIQAVHDLGPYMVLAPGISLAHARPQDGVLKEGISIINLSKPVKFGHETNDPVSVVICFCGMDNGNHVRILQVLSSFLIEENNQTLLKTVQSKQKLLNTIHNN